MKHAHKTAYFLSDLINFGYIRLKEIQFGHVKNQRSKIKPIFYCLLSHKNLHDPNSYPHILGKYGGFRESVFNLGSLGPENEICTFGFLYF